MEQVKGPEELRERIIQASKQARNQPDYPQELLPDFVPNTVTICDKYLNNYQKSHIQSNGKIYYCNNAYGNWYGAVLWLLYNYCNAVFIAL